MPSTTRPKGLLDPKDSCRFRDAKALYPIKQFSITSGNEWIEWMNEWLIW